MVAESTGGHGARDGSSRRRRRAFGAVEELRSGRFRARVLGPDGRYMNAPSTFATRGDAGLWVDVQRTDIARGVWKLPERRGPVPTVGRYVEQWIGEHPTARTSTKELYTSVLRTCIVPELDRIALSELTPQRVRRWHYELGARLAADAERRRAELEARGKELSAASVRDGSARQAQAYRLLRAAMATAVTDGLIDAQPCRIPSAGKSRPVLGRDPAVSDRLLSPAQVAAVADAMPPRYRVLVLAAAWSGLRQGELLALRRADVELDTDPAVVRVSRGVRRSDAGTIHIGLPKTKSSVRSVSLPVPLADALAAHLADFVGPEPDALVFGTSAGTVPARSNLNATLRRALDQARAPQIRFHDLRHVAQVFAAEAGATLPELMARLGHVTPAAAMVYLHARSDRDAVLTDALSVAMDAAATGGP